jgi:hypothetical protein
MSSLAYLIACEYCLPKTQLFTFNSSAATYSIWEELISFNLYLGFPVLFRCRRDEHLCNPVHTRYNILKRMDYKQGDEVEIPLGKSNIHLWHAIWGNGRLMKKWRCVENGLARNQPYCQRAWSWIHDIL